MNLKDLLGTNYHEGMTFEEVSAALNGMKLVDLSTGAYVDKNKYEADIKAKDAELQKKSSELNARMTADEKAQAKEAEKDALIETLQQTIKDSMINSSRSTAESILAGSRSKLGIDAKDEGYTSFISSISSDNLESTKTVATYIDKLITDSYQKGKDDASKNSMGAFSKGVTTASTDGAKTPEEGSYGAELAKMETAKAVDSNLYFKRD